MSHQLRNHSEDLKHLEEDGYDFIIRDARLIVREVPYLNDKGEICSGTLACPLNTDGEKTAQPAEHTMMFAGEIPHDVAGQSLESKLVASTTSEKCDGHEFKFVFSRLPHGGKYRDYYEKVTTYCHYICRHAQSKDESATPQRHNPRETDEDESVFKYLDTNSARNSTIDLNEIYNGKKIGIIGLGGTGSYILDLVSKCCVSEIKLFDGDIFKDHNAFRAPGAASIEDLKSKMSKVMYFKEKYSQMHKGIVAVPIYLGEENLNELDGLDFIFVCIDPSTSKAAIIQHLVREKVSFIDSGVGLHRQRNGLAGLIRVTSISQHTPPQFAERIPVQGGGDDDLYATNIQVAEVNALAAALSVFAWKRHLGFYDDLEEAHRSTYTIDGNNIVNVGGSGDQNEAV